MISITERTILPDLRSHPYSDDIKNQADTIYNKMIPRVRRGKIRAQLLFYCVYCAHLELDRDVNPLHLGVHFGLSSGDVQRCDSIFSPLQTGYKPPNKNTTALKYLPEYCRSMNISDDAIDNITKTATLILKKDLSLHQESPQTVAAGLLRYITEIKGIETDDPTIFVKITGRSSVTIEGMYKRIATIDNN
jgi:transcription initiation factor TFIIIB Brf1 subunit/transcription initiation factor TFIIB